MFDRYVSEKDRSSIVKQVLIVGSIVIHAAAIAGLVIYSFIHVEEVPPPPLTVTFISAAAPPPPPPPPPPAGGHKSTTPKPKIPKQPVVQPKDVQPLIQPKEP